MEKMEVLAQTRYRINSLVCDVAALCEDKVPQPRCGINDLLYRPVCESSTGREVENTEMFVGPVWWERQKSEIVDQLAVCEAQLTQ